MEQIKSCGIIVMRTQPQMSFLLLQHPHRYDLPKGHIEAGEDEWSCAIRELYEETGIEASALELDRQFRFSVTYESSSPRYAGKTMNKTVVIFLAWLNQEVNVKVSEHTSYNWIEWKPPHTIQKKTIDPLLAALARYFNENDLKIL